MKRIKYFFAFLIFGSVSICKSQTVLNGLYVPEHVPTKKVIQYSSIIEKDVMWEKRVWRVIDCREKINFPLYYPLQPTTFYSSLWDIIKDQLTRNPGVITPYKDFNEATLSSFGGDQFLYPLFASSSNYFSDLSNMIGWLGELSEEPIQEYDPVTGVMRSKIKSIDPVTGFVEYEYPPRDTFYYESKDIVAWEIMEDWFFDKQRSVMDVRIIGIAPVVAVTDNYTKQITGYKRLMWLYFPELRYILQNHYVFNRMNDAQRMSFDDLFWKRMFNSYVKKESNVYDRNVADYTSGVDALLESERIQKAIQTMEHDVWDL